MNRSISVTGTICKWSYSISTWMERQASVQSLFYTGLVHINKHPSTGDWIQLPSFQLLVSLWWCSGFSSCSHGWWLSWAWKIVRINQWHTLPRIAMLWLILATFVLCPNWQKHEGECGEYNIVVRLSIVRLLCMRVRTYSPTYVLVSFKGAYPTQPHHIKSHWMSKWKPT